MDTITRSLMSGSRSNPFKKMKDWTPYQGSWSINKGGFRASSVNFGVTAADTITQADSYLTALDYINYLKSKHPSVGPSSMLDRMLLGNPIVTSYYSHTVSPDGASGTVFYRRVTMGYTLDMTIFFRLVDA